MGISYIICAAGLGTRTQAISKTKAKPLLRLKGRSLIQRSLDSLNITHQDQIIIAHGASISQEQFATALDKETFEKAQFIEIGSTRGQLETALLASQMADTQNSIAIFNSDTYFKSSSFYSAVDDTALDGLIPCSQEEGVAWSFCKLSGRQINDVDLVSSVAEKERISDWCSVGLYWFKRHDQFVSYAQQELQHTAGTQREAYVAPMYNAMIGDGLNIGMNPCEIFKPMGSVEQIEKYWTISLDEMVRENYLT